ncbi:MAG: extracellular solute-binding protein [Firmicutes bacterium]|jgi:ABC-type glycerol-3-phosphate transport system substrate-binding protein|nr:extracellular solute-binding protein [Bacillota bacterium]
MSWSYKTRRLGIGVVFVLLLAALVGMAQAKTTLTVGTWLTLDGWESTYGPQMDLFEKTNPDVELDVMTIAGHSEYAAKIAVLAATGEITDVLQLPSEQVAPLVAGGILEDLEPWINRDKNLDTRAWNPGAVNAVRYMGIMFGMPGFVVNYTYAYNKDILAERGVVPPTADKWVTWDEIRDIGRRSTVDVDGDGVPEIWGYYHGTSYTEMIPLIFQAGWHMFDEDDLLDIDHPLVYKGMNWLLALIRENVHGGTRPLFYQGNVATMRLGSWEMNNIINAQTPIAVTSGIQEATKKGVAYVTSFAMTSNSRRKDTAWRYLKYLASRESQEFVAARGRVPIRRDVSFPLEMRDILMGLTNSLGYAEPYPYHIHSDYIQRAFNAGIAPVWRGEATPEAVVPEIQRTINAYLRQQSR